MRRAVFIHFTGYEYVSLEHILRYLLLRDPVIKTPQKNLHAKMFFYYGIIIFRIKLTELTSLDFDYIGAAAFTNYFFLPNAALFRGWRLFGK